MGTGWQKSTSLAFLTCSYIIYENAAFGYHGEEEEGKPKKIAKSRFQYQNVIHQFEICG